jgi:hypothetical protein
VMTVNDGSTARRARHDGKRLPVAPVALDMTTMQADIVWEGHCGCVFN